MVSRQYHTPFCSKDCKIEHHDLVTVLCLDSSQKFDELPDLLKECIDSYRNWDHNSEVPDPLEELRCPLLYLASAFGKAGLVKALLQDNFDPHVVTPNGETALHGAVQHIYRTGSLKSQGLKVASTLGPIKNRRRAFQRILVTLTDVDPKMLFVQDNEGNTAFHVAAEEIWNDRQNDRLGKSATFFQSCMTSMLNRMLELEEAGEVIRAEILEALNAENNDGDTIFHILARDYAFGFKTMKEILKKFFPGQVPSKVNKENQTVSSIALERNRKKAMMVFPEFLEQSRREGRILPTSEPEISDNGSSSPSTSKDSEEFTTSGEKLPDMSSREPKEPPITISETDSVPQVSHSIVEEEDSSNEVITASKETVTSYAGCVEANMSPLPTNPGQHDLLTLSMDSNLGKPSQMEEPSFLSLSQKSNLIASAFDMSPLPTNSGQHDLLTLSMDSNLGKPSQMEEPSFLSLSQKSNLIASPFDNVISEPVAVEAMYVTETLTVNPDQHSSSERGERREVALQLNDVSDTSNQSSAREPADPKVPFTFTPSSSDTKASGTSSKDPSGAPPDEERMAERSEENIPDKASEPNQFHSIAGSENNAASCQGSCPGTESEATQTETFTASVNDASESCDVQVPLDNSVFPDACETPALVTDAGSSDDVALTQQSFENKAPQSHLEKAIDSSPAKAVHGPVVQDLLDPLRKQIQQSAEYIHMYTCGMLDTPVLSSQSQEQETISSTSLASASTETIPPESFESMDVNKGASDERSTILKCITDNSFLEFLITEGIDLDTRSKRGIVKVVMAQYSNKLNHVENTIPKLAAQIKDTETTIVQQTEKVKKLQEELEFVKGEIVKNENLLHGFINEQQEMRKHRKALKRKVARCEGTMKNVLGDAKKVRLE